MSTELFGMEDDTPTGTEVEETDEKRHTRLRKEFIENGANDLRFYYSNNKTMPTEYNAWHTNKLKVFYHGYKQCRKEPRAYVDRSWTDPAKANYDRRLVCWWEDKFDDSTPGPFLKCPRFGSFSGIGYGCSNFANTLDEMYAYFSPHAQVYVEGGTWRLQPCAPVPCGERAHRYQMLGVCQNEYVNFYEMIKHAGISLDDCWGRCRCCDTLIPPGLMCWPLTAKDMEGGLQAKQAIWGDGTLSHGKPLNPHLYYCNNRETFEVNLGYDADTLFPIRESFFKGCCNSAPLGRGCTIGNTGFGPGDHEYQIVCNRCAVTQPGEINYEEDGAKLDDEGQKKDESKRAEDKPAPVKPNFLSGIGCAGMERLSLAACAKHWWCAKHTSYQQNCEACWECHPCECLEGRRDGTIKAIKELIPTWQMRFYDGGNIYKRCELTKERAPAKETFELFKMCAKTRRAVRTRSDDEVRRDLAVKIAEYLNPKATGDPNEPQSPRELSDAQFDDIKQMNDDVNRKLERCEFHWSMCKCKAKDVNYRLSLIERQAQLADWSTASYIAQDRWRKVMLWFHFLWGRKADCAVAGEHARTPASPYLDLGRDKHLFEQILLSALKNPEKYREFNKLRSGVNGAKDNTLNAFDWAIIISMLVQFCRCAYEATDEEIEAGLDNKTWDEWRAPPRPGTDEFDHAVFGFVDGESKRWSLREMVEYGLAKVEDYCKNQQEKEYAGTDGPVFSGARQAGGDDDANDGGDDNDDGVDTANKYTIKNIANAMAKENGYLSEGVQSLVAFRPFFLRKERWQMADGGAKKVGEIRGHDNLNEEDKKKAAKMATCAKTQIKDSLRKFYHGLGTLSKLLASKKAKNPNWDFEWTAQLPQAIFEMVVAADPDAKNTNYDLIDINAADGVSAIVLTGAAADKAREYRGKDILAAQDAVWEIDPAGEPRKAAEDVNQDVLLTPELLNRKENAAKKQEEKAKKKEEKAKQKELRDALKAQQARELASETPTPELVGAHQNSVQAANRRASQLRQNMKKRKRSESKQVANGKAPKTSPKKPSDKGGSSRMHANMS